jgi:hypothetical protein
MKDSNKFLPLKNRLRTVAAGIENFLQQHGAKALALFAAVYYGLYFNAHLTLTGEAGSNVLIAQRINEGWRPIKDMFIGYNLMWFYPLAWIFEFTGPHLLASRIYFMVLAGISGLLGFLLVRRVTGFAIPAAIAGGLMILMPGAMYRNTVGFVGTLAAFALVYGYVVPHRSRVSSILWMGFAGAAMSLCYLIRIEPSLIATVVWAGLVFLYPFGVRGEFLSRLRIVGAGTLVSIAAFAAIHAPFVYHAHRQGFGSEFTRQYSQFVNLLRWELEREIRKFQPAPRVAKPIAGGASLFVDPPPPAPAGNATSQPVKPVSADSSAGRRPRPPLLDSFQNGRISFFPLSMYFPVFSAFVLALAGGGFFLGGSLCANPLRRQAGLAILATTGCALSLFPQYFFFRPDSVHLAEFMVPFYPALACAAAAASFLLRGGIWQALLGWVLISTVFLQVIISFNSLFGREGSGSIRISRGKTAMFEAPGGIRFRVKPEELSEWQGLRDALSGSTRDGDFLVTYPYVPLLNVMAQMPSYQFKLYVDNATESRDFADKTIEELRLRQPAAVVVHNRNINQTEFSRFRNWASPVHDFLLKEYVLTGTFFNHIEVFARPDRARQQNP